MKTDGSFPSLLESFFIDRLMRQRQASPHTITSYRDTFRLLIQYVGRHLRKGPSDLTMRDLDTTLIGGFLDYLQRERDNSARTRNVRLAAIHSFFRYVALHAPEHSALAQRVLLMPSKRYVREPVSFLTSAETNALLSAPNLNTWRGRRDRALLLLAVRTGLRACEITSLRCENIVLHAGAHVQCIGKGRKQRCTPIGKDTVAVVRAWLREHRGRPSDPLFPTTQGAPLGYDGLAYLLNKHVAVAAQHYPSLVGKHITFHSLRHSLAMSLLHQGVGQSVIALWLGHERLETTSVYLQADMLLKEKALAKTNASGSRVPRYRPSDPILAFLSSL